MIKKRQIESSQKEFGELFAIHIPDLKPPDEDSLRHDEDSADFRFDLRPEFPSHVPTPDTINLGINYQIQTIFAGDDIKPKKRAKRQKNLEEPANPAKAEVTPTISSPRSTMKILIASPSSTKWGSDVWNSFKVNGSVDSSPSVRKNPFSDSISANSDESSSGGNADHISLTSDEAPKEGMGSTRRGPLRLNMTVVPTASPTKPVDKSLSEKHVTVSPTHHTRALTPSKAKEKWILSEGTLERVDPIVTVANQKTSYSSPSSLQRKWMMENALNLHNVCQRDDGDERESPRRPFFLPRLR